MNISLFGASDMVAQTPPRNGELFAAPLGGTTVDLSRVELPETLHLTAFALMGGVQFIVPPETHVEFRGLSVMGGRKFKAQQERLTPPRSLVYITAVAIMGAVEAVEAVATAHDAPVHEA